MSERKNNEINYLVMRDNARAISEGIRKRAEKGGDMSVLSVLPWLKDEKRAVTCCGCGCESTITMGEALEGDEAPLHPTRGASQRDVCTAKKNKCLTFLLYLLNYLCYENCKR